MQRKSLKLIALFCLTSLITISASAQRVSAPILPDHAKTPGDILDVTKADICVPGYSKNVRNVPESVKKQDYVEYGITSHKPKEYEVDHLISLELGGSNHRRENRQTYRAD
jgi:hypothetical protein